MNNKSQGFQVGVISAGGCLWLAALYHIIATYALSTELIILAFVPLTIIVGKFTITFQLPSGLRFTSERMTFTLSDAVVLLIAYKYGFAPAVVLTGIESFVASRGKSTLRASFFSSGMMTIAVAAAACTLQATLRYVFGETEHSLLALAIAMFAASVALTIVNIGTLSMLLALRHDKSFAHYFKNFLAVAPTLLVTGTVATLMHIALSYNVLVLVVVGAPVLVAIYLVLRGAREGVEKRVSMMEKAHRETIEALAVTINAKDEVTHDHVSRVQIYATGVARLLGCSDAEIEALKAGALLHDIGKIGVPDYILHKPGKLTAEEFEKMKMHTVVGANILSRVEFPYPVVPIVRSHHERWDGKGYPDGLAGEDIPLTARIISVVDCFDAVREDRQYRRGMTHEEAIDLLIKGSGTQYDPKVVNTFVTHLPEFEAEVLASRDVPVPTFGIEPTEQLSEAARAVAPAAGLAASLETEEHAHKQLRHNELVALYGLAQELTNDISAEKTLDLADKALQRIVTFDLFTVTLADAATGENIVRHASGAHAESLLNRRVTNGEGVTGWVIANNRAFRNTNPQLDFSLDRADQFGSLRTLAVFPLSKEGERHGAISLYSAKLGEYTADHARVIEQVAALLAGALSTKARVARATTVAVTEAEQVVMPIGNRSSEASMALLNSELAH